MKRSLFVFAAAAAAVATACGGTFPLNEGWKFHRGDAKGAEAVAFDDAAWDVVRVPHDWAIGEAFDKTIDAQSVKVIEDGETKARLRVGRTGCLPWIGAGWYRRTVAIPADAARAELVFDGAMSHAAVYANGKKAGEWKNGYNSFAVDLTPFLPAKEIVVAVRLENPEESSRWYPGAGLIRPVALVTGGAFGFERWGTFVRTTRLSPEGARVVVTTATRGEKPRGKCEIAYRVAAEKGGETFRATRPLTGDETSHAFTIPNPRTWTPETPELYVLEETLLVDGKPADFATVRFGVRTVEWRNGRFELNGVARKFKGACLHHDAGPVGAAFNAAAFRRQVKLLKEIGCDSIRTAHNAPAPGQLEICDELGMMVMAESFDEWAEAKCKNGYHLHFADWWRRDVANLVRRNRNHPSVVMWSIGNEITDQRTAAGTALSRAMQDLCHDLDPTRPVTQGHSWMPQAIDAGGVQVMDVPGVTYRLPFYGMLHDASRFGGVLGAETASTVSSRGCYAFPDEIGAGARRPDGQSSSYDVEYAPWSNLPDDDWAVQDDNAWTLGEFVWTGFDYLGEPYPYDAHASRSSYFGIYDLAGLPKDRAFLYRSRWLETSPTLHLLPHWTWPGREGKTTPAYCYTSWPEAELFVNGKSQGRLKRDPASRLDRYRLRWRGVVYEPGELKVVAYDEAGRPAAERTARTAGAPARLVAEVDRARLAAATADGTPDLAFATVKVVDKDGNLCPDAAPQLHFAVAGAVRFKAAENGDATSFEKLSAPTRKAFRGMCVAVLEAGAKPGAARFAVSAEGLGAATVDLRVDDFDVRAFGARAGGGAAANRTAIQRAVDAAAAAGGGRVVVPAGTFLTGSVELKDGVEFHLAKGAVLKATTDLSLYNADDAYPQCGSCVPEEWSGAHLLYAVERENVAVTGEGTIDGSGPEFFGPPDTNYWPWYRHGLKLHPLDRDRYRTGQQIAIVECRGVRIEDFTFTNSACWTCFIHGCTDVTVKGYKAFNDRTIANSDGLSIDCCRNVAVTGCEILTGDDGIAIRASGSRLKKPQACENVVVSNCTISSCCYGIRIGVGDGDVKNVRVSHCRFPETAGCIGFTCAWIAGKRNVHVSDVAVSDCVFEDSATGVEFQTAHDDSPSAIDGVSFDRCLFRTAWGHVFGGGGETKKHVPRNVSFRDCTFEAIKDFANRGEAWSPAFAGVWPGRALVGNHVGENVSFERCRAVWPKESGPWCWRLTRAFDGRERTKFVDCDFSEPPTDADAKKPPAYEAPKRVEAEYDFRKRLSAPRQWRDRGFTGAPKAADEIALDDHWTFAVESDEPVVKHAAKDLKDFLEKRCWARCAGKDGKKRIVVAVAPEKNPLTARISVSENEIRVTGATPRETAQACYRFEDELERRDRPAAKLGSRTYTRMFSPRMTHSGYEIEKFPDWHMDQIARAGMDAILVYVREPPDVTRNGREDMNALVRRAAEHGLDVYAYFDWWGRPVAKHPLDPGAEEYYDKAFGSIVENAPGIKGMVIVGESCSFPSRDPGVYGYAWSGSGIAPDPKHPKKGVNGFWPASDWKEALELIAKVTRKHNPDFDVLFWTYNWAGAPEKDRLALIERIPTNVSLHVTFEMGDGHVDDYSISRPGPSFVFTGETGVATRRGIRVTAMSNTGGRTWDFGGIPYVPAPYRWLDRFRGLRDAHANASLTGLMDEHHYGFAPNPMADFAKIAFTEETRDADLEPALRALAVREFGALGAEEGLAAWKDWSEAMRGHSAKNFDQYGCLRIGSTYPFAFLGERLPDPPPWFGDEPGRKGGHWTYLWETAGGGWGWQMKKADIAKWLAAAEKELALWRSGNAHAEKAAKTAPPELRDATARHLALGRYCEAALRTSRNVKKFWLLGPQGDKEELLKTLDDEEANVKALMPYVEFDSQLGWEPSMRYVTSPRCLEWKLEQLASVRRRLASL
ncbi:MAG: DUF4982 domain-containing protein [Kiritimatiellae bacterium]|nr:DUF4982 domain-containing protein [Kiritimatiellia bacterium]